MSSRYSNIRQAVQLQAALTALRAHEDRVRTPQINSRGAQGARKNVYVNAFGFTFESTEVLRVRNNSADYTTLSTPINNAATGAKVTDALGSNTVVVRPGFSPARIVWFRNATRSVTPARSEATNQEYLKYAGERSSCAFGRKTVADSQNSVFDAIKTAITAANPGNVINRITLQPERVRYS
jgi:hypothetical protein